MKEPPVIIPPSRPEPRPSPGFAGRMPPGSGAEGGPHATTFVFRTASQSPPGAVPGAIAALLGILGVFTPGAILFVPLGTVFALVGLVRALLGFNLSGFMVAALGLGCCVAGFITSPSLWVVVAALGFGLSER